MSGGQDASKKTIARKRRRLNLSERYNVQNAEHYLNANCDTIVRYQHQTPLDALDLLEDFIETYWVLVSKEEKEELAYQGALVLGFDPGDFNLFVALKLMYPEAAFLDRLGQFNIGEICRGLLACGHQMEVGVPFVVRWLTDLALAVSRVITLSEARTLTDVYAVVYGLCSTTVPEAVECD